MKGNIGSAIVIIAYCAVLFVMVRPGSKGPSLVKAIGGAIGGVTKAATGGGTWAKG